MWNEGPLKNSLSNKYPVQEECAPSWNGTFREVCRLVTTRRHTLRVAEKTQKCITLTTNLSHICWMVENAAYRKKRNIQPRSQWANLAHQCQQTNLVIRLRDVVNYWPRQGNMHCLISSYAKMFVDDRIWYDMIRYVMLTLHFYFFWTIRPCVNKQGWHDKVALT